MDRYAAVLQAWRETLAYMERYPGATLSGPPEFRPFHPGTETDHRLIAAQYEARGMADLLLIRAHGAMLPLTVLTSLGSLVLAAHWHRVAGDPERSVLAGRRAWLELQDLLCQVDTGQIELPVDYVRWYILEMAGDAAACFDPAAALRCYLEAEGGFRLMDPTDQASDACDPFPGGYIDALALLPRLRPGCGDDGVMRVRWKRQHWLGATFGDRRPGVHYRERPGAYGVIFGDQGKVALISTERGYFLPGGGLAGAEDPEAALRRELLEETGHEATILKYIGQAAHYGSPAPGRHLKSVGHFFLVSLGERRQEPTDLDHTLVWVAPDDAERLLHLEHQRWAVREGRQLL